MKRLRHEVISVWHRLGAFFGKRRRERDLRDELEFHLAMRQADHERAGASPAEARRTASLQFGNVASLKEQTSEMWSFLSFEHLAQTSAARFTTWILGIFAAVALLLSVIGIYGVMSYLVAQRTREFAIRLALGASRAQVIGAVLRHGTMLVAAGTVLGVAVTATLYRLFRELLFDVAVWDAAGGIAVLTLAAVAIVACLVPAIRATRVEPVVALRG